MPQKREIKYITLLVLHGTMIYYLRVRIVTSYIQKRFADSALLKVTLLSDANTAKAHFIEY